MPVTYHTSTSVVCVSMTVGFHGHVSADQRTGRRTSKYQHNQSKRRRHITSRKERACSLATTAPTKRHHIFSRWHLLALCKYLSRAPSTPKPMRVLLIDSPRPNHQKFSLQETVPSSSAAGLWRSPVYAPPFDSRNAKAPPDCCPIDDLPFRMVVPDRACKISSVFHF